MFTTACKRCSQLQKVVKRSYIITMCRKGSQLLKMFTTADCSKCQCYSYVQKMFTTAKDVHNCRRCSQLQKVVKRSYNYNYVQKMFTSAENVHNCRLCSKCHNVIAMCRKWQKMFTTAESSQTFIYYNYVQKMFTSAENVHNCRLCSKCYSYVQKMFTTAKDVHNWSNVHILQHCAEKVHNCRKCSQLQTMFKMS